MRRVWLWLVLIMIIICCGSAWFICPYATGLLHWHWESYDMGKHWNKNVVILTKFSSLAALEVVILTTSSAASDEHFIKMKTFPFQWSWLESSRHSTSRYVCGVFSSVKKFWSALAPFSHNSWLKFFLEELAWTSSLCPKQWLFSLIMM